MTAGLETFAKVRALHDRITNADKRRDVLALLQRDGENPHTPGLSDREIALGWRLPSDGRQHQEIDQMTRPRTTASTEAPPAQPETQKTPPVPSWQSTIETISDALLALVVSAESQPSVGPGVKAFKAAIRRKGEEAAAAGGAEAMEAALRFVIEAAPDRARRRETIITQAWTGLPNWRT